MRLERKQLDTLAQIIRRKQLGHKTEQGCHMAFLIARGIAKEFNLDETRFLKSCGFDPLYTGTSSSP